MTQQADTATPRPALVYEVVCGEALEAHVEAFRAWAGLLWELTIEALLSSGTVERPDDVYDKALWEGVMSTGVKPRTRRLSAKAWSEVLAEGDLWGLGVTAGPLPNVPEPPGSESSTIHLYSNWHPHHIIPNWTSFLLPARYTTGVDDAWVGRLVAGFAAFGAATRARAGLIGWTWRMMEFTGYPVAKTDFSTVLWRSGWAVLLSEGHMTNLGGASALDATGLFHRVERVGDGTYLVRSRTDLLDFDEMHLREVEAVLRPVLLPSPFDPAATLDRS